MQKLEYKRVFEQEGSHFYYRGNHNLVLAFVKKYLKKNKGNNILDVGCGTGLLTKKLSHFGTAIGIDISKDAEKYSRKRGVKFIRASVNRIPFNSNKFDLVTAIDVIYHENVDDILALKEVYRVLKRGGLLILRVPANKWLTLSHDKTVHTRERYKKGELHEKLIQARFKILKLTFVNATLLPLAIAFPNSQVKRLPIILNYILAQLLEIENVLIYHSHLPFGLGLIAVCKKI